MKPSTKAFSLLCLTALALIGAETYQKPPKEIIDLLNSPGSAALVLSPTRDYALQGRPVRYPPIAELSQPMLRLAGMRINPKTNGLHDPRFQSTLTLKKLPEGTEIKIALPPNPKLSIGRWSPDGKHFAFTNTTNSGIELWIGDLTGATHKIANLRVNEVLGAAGGGGGGGRGGAGAGGPVQWLADSKTLLVQMVKPNRGAPPADELVPEGPHVQESLGGGRGVVTHEDMLETPHDEKVWEFYATSQLAMVDSLAGTVTPFGKAGVIESARPSPDGKYVIVTMIHRPFSYLYPARQFPKEIDVWDRAGNLAHHIASLPLAVGGRGGNGPDPTDPADDAAAAAAAAPRGTQNLEWRFNEPATLMWTETLAAPGGRAPAGNPAPATATATGGRGTGAGRGGRGGNGAPRPAQLMALRAPFTGTPQTVFKSDTGLAGLTWFENGHWILLDSGGAGGRGGGAAPAAGRGARTPTQAKLIDLDKPNEAPRTLWTRNPAERYSDVGRPMEKAMPGGMRAIILDGDNVFLQSNGPSPTGDHPFVDRYNLTTQKSEHLFRCDDTHYETVDALMDAHGTKLLTHRESPTEPPNYFLRTVGGALTAVTHDPDPQPLMRQVSKQRVEYKRSDGVDLSFILYLPPNYKPGTRLPTVLWAYPREFEDADAAGVVTGSTQRFTEVSGYSEIFFAVEGYAVLDNAAMPVVGDRRTVNDHFVEEIIKDSKAAIDKAVEMGVTDPTRVGVGGHSYGAFMTDNLLAQCDLFRAGIAESGAPNRTLTPFGFQNERRTIWEAPETYLKMSPFMYANKIKAPLLLIHGEADDNDGTFPIQSERMYEAVRGNGGTVRLVFLPYEAHGYRAWETIEHVLWEKFSWFDKYVKNAGPLPPAAPPTSNNNNH
jgi:dipeptidyl aminopeptidase/acylaminoacyl peptidase